MLMTLQPEEILTDEEFRPEPKTQGEYVKAIWYRLGRVEQKVTITNGRVRALEKAIWALGGGIVVLAMVVAPIFISLVTTTAK